jgi:uncharacterized membrane protein HdeD (DUF308 family)
MPENAAPDASTEVSLQPFRRFLGFILFAAVVWASYAALLGFAGGKTFADNHTVAFLVAFGCALAVSGVIELIRWLRHRGEHEEQRSPAGGDQPLREEIGASG